MCQARLYWTVEKAFLKLKIRERKKTKNCDVPSASPPCTIGFCAPVWLLAPQERTRPRVEKS